MIAGLFIVMFFAALPLWFLTTQERWVRFSGGGGGDGTPWRCTVSRWPALGAEPQTFEPSSIWADRVRGRRGVELWQIHFKEAEGWRDILAGRTTNERAYRVAQDLEAARKAGVAIERELAPDATFFLAIGLVVIFAGAGVLIARSA
jgi:hypothetical protein